MGMKLNHLDAPLSSKNQTEYIISGCWKRIRAVPAGAHFTCSFSEWNVRRRSVHFFCAAVYYMLKYPLKYAPAVPAGVQFGPAGAHLSWQLNNQWWQSHALSSWIYCVELINRLMASGFTYIEKSYFFKSVDKHGRPQHAKGYTMSLAFFSPGWDKYVWSAEWARLSTSGIIWKAKLRDVWASTFH